jgi:hypothetical protein
MRKVGPLFNLYPPMSHCHYMLRLLSLIVMSLNPLGNIVIATSY